jgi:GT2 family glycosyltransferase
MNHINVIIATPGHSVMSAYVHSLFKLLDTLSEKGLTWAWSSQYSSHVGDAREMTLNGDAENSYTEQRPFKGQITYDKILWIDSDITFNPEDAIKLIESDKDIISGAYLLGSGEVTIYPKMLGPGYRYEEVKEMTEPIQVDGCGFGFIAVKSGVFESLTRPWFQAAAIQTEDGSNLPLMGEDLSWCKRVKDQGFEIWFDPSVKVTHNKMMKLTWDGVRH